MRRTRRGRRRRGRRRGRAGPAHRRRGRRRRRGRSLAAEADCTPEWASSTAALRAGFDAEHARPFGEHVGLGLGAQPLARRHDTVHDDAEVVADAGGGEHLFGVLRARHDPDRRACCAQLLDERAASPDRARCPLRAAPRRTPRSCDCPHRTRCRRWWSRIAPRDLDIARAQQARDAVVALLAVEMVEVVVVAVGGLTPHAANRPENISRHACMCTSAVGVSMPSRSKSTPSRKWSGREDPRSPCQRSRGV